jgi:hypothetical protein
MYSPERFVKVPARQSSQCSFTSPVSGTTVCFKNLPSGHKIMLAEKDSDIECDALSECDRDIVSGAVAEKDCEGVNDLESENDVDLDTPFEAVSVGTRDPDSVSDFDAVGF